MLYERMGGATSDMGGATYVSVVVAGFHVRRRPASLFKSDGGVPTLLSPVIHHTIHLHGL